MRQLFILTFLCLTAQLSAQNERPEINNLDISIIGPEIEIGYDLSDAEGESIKMSLLVSMDGLPFTVVGDEASGDIGFPIEPGLAKTITWTPPQEGNYRIKLVADDLYEIDIQSIVDQVDSNRLRSDLEFIEGVRHRTANPSHLEAVKNEIEQRFMTANLDTYRQDFAFGNYTGQNIIGTWTGGDKVDTSYIVDGHFDSVDDSPGADDNGSAVAGMLEVLRVLAPYEFSKTLRFIGFDLEEAGLRGAIAYVSNQIPVTETIEGVFNLEMIGYHSNEPNSQTFPAGFEILYSEQYAAIEADEFRGNFITNIGDQNSGALQMAYDNAAAQYVPGLKVTSLLAPPNWQAITPDFGRSDHAPFWIQGIPALMLTDGSNFRNPFYHSPNDLVETLDFTFMTNVVKAVVGAVAEEAEINHSTTVTSEVSYIASVHHSLDCGLNISPIPTDKYLRLSFDNCPFQQLEVQLFDVLAKLVLKETIRPNFEEGVTLDLKNLEAGVYWLNVSDGAKSLSRKVVVN